MDDQKPSGLKVTGYGEDSLTLWALGGKLLHILEVLKDASSVADCEAFYRPGFGRRGGDNSAEFGEFDFLIMSATHLYLGESKWNRSGESRSGVLRLRKEQEVRHALMRRYVSDWFSFRGATETQTTGSWDQFVDWAPPNYNVLGVPKNVAPRGSQTSRSLLAVLDRAWNHYGGRCPEIIDLILFFYDPRVHSLPDNKTGFAFVPIPYDETQDGYVEL